MTGDQPLDTLIREAVILRPGDTLVLALSPGVNPSQMQEFKEHLDERLPDVKTLVVGGDIHLYVLRSGEVAE